MLKWTDHMFSPFFLKIVYELCETYRICFHEHPRTPAHSHAYISRQYTPLCKHMHSHTFSAHMHACIYVHTHTFCLTHSHTSDLNITTHKHWDRQAEIVHDSYHLLTWRFVKSSSAAGRVRSLKPHWVSFTPRTHRNHTRKWNPFIRNVRNKDLWK